jgi:hypothetical protein
MFKNKKHLKHVNISTVAIMNFQVGSFWPTQVEQKKKPFVMIAK